MNIEPSINEFVFFINSIINKINHKLIITTGKKTPDILVQLKNEKKNNDFHIFDNLSFQDLECITIQSKTLISCHGAISHVAAAKNIKQIDIIDKSYHYGKWTDHFRNYNYVFRNKFKTLSENILRIL